MVVAQSNARQLNVHASTICRLQQRYAATGNISDRPRSGRPDVTNGAQDGHIVLQHLRDLTAKCMSDGIRIKSVTRLFEIVCEQRTWDADDHIEVQYWQTTGDNADYSGLTSTGLCVSFYFD